MLVLHARLPRRPKSAETVQTTQRVSSAGQLNEQRGLLVSTSLTLTKLNTILKGVYASTEETGHEHQIQNLCFMWTYY